MSVHVEAGAARPDPATTATEQSTAELVQHASEQMSRLIREELALARAELADKGRRTGSAAGLIGGGGLVALYGIGALVLAAILGLAQGIAGWLAALLIGVVLLIIAGVLGLMGRERVRQAMPPVPSGVTESMRADVNAVTAAVRERRSV